MPPTDAGSRSESELSGEKNIISFFVFLHNFSSKRNKNRLFHLSSLFRKKYTNFTSLCKSENLSKKENFSKILLTGSFPQAKFSFPTPKSLDFP